MSAITGISWTDRTWNPVVGCTRVSQGCKHCYAKTLHDARHKAYTEGKLQHIPQYAEPFETVQTLPGRLTDPLGWRKPSRVFVNSVSDLFHDDVPDEFILEVFSIMAQAPRHTFQILTKRPARMLRWFTEYLPAACSGESPAERWPLPNVWLGVSVENQAAADERIPLLIDTPAAIRFLSCEPLLGPVDIRRYAIAPAERKRRRDAVYMAFAYQANAKPPVLADPDAYAPGVDLVIVGGESGKGARPMHPDWARSLRDRCASVGVAFHLKQWGQYRPVCNIHADDLDERLNECDDDHVACIALNGVEWVNNEHRCDGQPPSSAWYMERVGHKRAGRELDGRIWHEFPRGGSADA